MTDKYADLREDIESFKNIVGELCGLEAQAAALLVDYDAQVAEIKKLRGLVSEMAENSTYETEYDGRMYSICHGCGAQDDEDHRSASCVYLRASAALSGEPT